MAVRVRKIKLTREQIRTAIIAWKGQRTLGSTQTFRQFLEARPMIQNLQDRLVDVQARDDIEGSTVDIVDMILMDIRSYTSAAEFRDEDLG